MISINLPLTTVIDYYTLNTDCVAAVDTTYASKEEVFNLVPSCSIVTFAIGPFTF
jgi:hypothetical protein